MKLLEEKRVKIVHVPESNMKLGSGVADITWMTKREMTLGLGTDGCASNNDLDLFSEMDSAAKLAKVFDHDPLSLNAGEVLKMATTGGAEVMGLEKEIGSLEKGKKADIIVVDLNRPHLCPLYDPRSALVYSANGADVKDVIVGGRVLMKERKFTEIDPYEVMRRVNEISAGIRNY
jgi:5-methylthioadenosine/S-adenosylhomocysteine deaminase